MTARIRLAAAGDVPRATAILSDGFAADPVMQWVFGPATAVALPLFFGFMLGEALVALGATYVAEHCCSVWTPPGAEPWSDPELGVRFTAVMADVLTDASLQRLAALDEVTQGAHPAEPHWYLGMLATRTRAQGTGAGARMLSHTLERVDGEGLPAYLESTNPRNVTLYERHGFAVVGSARLPGGPLLTFMWRRATGVSAATTH